MKMATERALSDMIQVVKSRAASLQVKARSEHLPGEREHIQFQEWRDRLYSTRADGERYSVMCSFTCGQIGGATNAGGRKQ
jgi:hypothetical protein